MTGVNTAQLNGILWALWNQSTNRLSWERPNGERVAEQGERFWRGTRLHPRPETCPHWEAYRACAQPLVTEAAQQHFAGESAEEALLKLFQLLQGQSAQGFTLLRAVAQHADLDRIIEADVWPWLEREAAAAEQIWRAEGYGVPKPPPALLEPPPYREQIEPMAKIAYRYHELATQVSYLAERESAQVGGAEGLVLDEASVRTLASCAANLLQYCAYSRSSAGRVRDAALRGDQLRQIGWGSAVDIDDEHRWWWDITTRSITSQIREEVRAAGTAEELAAVIGQLADEADVLGAALGDAFECLKWGRGIVGGTAFIGPELREVSERLSR